MKKIIITLFLIFVSSTYIYAKQTFQLSFPVKCEIGKNCWILNYVDNDPSPGWHDYKKGKQTYEAHTGTDIAIKDIAQMKKGVDVLAAESGFVVATRDSMPDINALSQDINKLQNLGCGNRVAIKHTSGWITDYCHMKKGSIKVKKGDFVSQGQSIGQIGMSGLSEFPHLHINVQNGNKFFDPFTGAQQYSKSTALPVWKPQVFAKLNYNPLVVYNVGVSDEEPTVLNVRNGKYDKNRLSFFSNMILVWLDMFHVEAGDSVSVEIKKQSGTVFFKKNIIIDKLNARKMIYVGKRKPANGFEKGVYSVKTVFLRPKTKATDIREFKFTVF